jgi:hypothetical protein
MTITMRMIEITNINQSKILHHSIKFILMIINLKKAAREKIINTILIDTKDFKDMDLIMKKLNILMIIMIIKGNNIIKF